jgi:hypothetical protein
MQGMSGLISQGQYNWYFDVKGFTGDKLIAEEVVQVAYPELPAERLKLRECSAAEMVSEINQQLSEERPMLGDGTRTAPFVLLPRDAAIWSLLKRCIDYERSRNFRYEAMSGSDLLHWGISGGFTFVIVNDSRRGALIINAGNTD